MSNTPNNYRPRTLEEVLNNIRDPQRWIERDAMVDVARDNPSLRGMIYGYVAEAELRKTLATYPGVTDVHKPDDHKKTKSDITFSYKDRTFTIQVKSLQTNSIRQIEDGTFTASLQNDASDRMRVRLPGGDEIETTCYVLGE